MLLYSFNFVSCFFLCLLFSFHWFQGIQGQNIPSHNNFHQKHGHKHTPSNNHTMLQSTYFAGRRIFGNIIQIDLQLAHILSKTKQSHPSSQPTQATITTTTTTITTTTTTTTTATSSTSTSTTSNTTTSSTHKQNLPSILKQNAINRTKHSKQLIHLLPFAVNTWKAILGTPCPHHRPDNTVNARGVTMAHYQIWNDFVQQETLHPNKNLTDDDILIVFEDDAHIVVGDIVPFLTEEIQRMSQEFVYLGWCLESSYHRHRGVGFAFCFHAYMMTRKGAKILVPEIDFCGASIELQMWEYISNHNDFSYGFPNMDFENYIVIPDYGISFTRGLFIQKKGFDSFNDHGKNY